MKFIKIIILTIVLSCGNAINLNAQKKESANTVNKAYLIGLTKATEKELANKQINFDGESMPVYNIEGKRIRGNEMMEAMMSGNYTPDFYMDKKKEIKVAVLKLSTEEEKKMLQEMQAQMSGESELIGTNASIFSATDMHGNKYSLDSLKGKIIVMNFWFVQCKPCIMEMPELNKLVERYKDEEVVFLAFATNDKSKIDTFLKKKSFSYHIIPSSKKIAAKYKVSSYPTHIIIDKNSKITYATAGLSATTISDIEKAIESLLKK